MTEKSFIRAYEVAEELDVSKSYAYKVIKQLNDELSAKGNITVAYLKDEIAGFAVHFNQK